MSSRSRSRSRGRSHEAGSGRSRDGDECARESRQVDLVGLGLLLTLDEDGGDDYPRKVPRYAKLAGKSECCVSEDYVLGA